MPSPQSVSNSSFYLHPEWLEAVAGKSFFYPCAYQDHDEPLRIFSEILSEFWFVDIHYPSGLNLPSVEASLPEFNLNSRRKIGDLYERIQICKDGSGHYYRNLKPSWLEETYEQKRGKKIVVVRKRGFGQVTLHNQFPEKSLGVFMHRGDSMGEGGSGVFFLDNRKARYGACRNLLDTLLARLADKALIISDGSNSKIVQTRIFHNKSVSGAAAYEYHFGKNFIYRGFRWSCVGWMSQRYGPTLIWGLSRLDETQS
jgi:hypothetical protein